MRDFLFEDVVKSPPINIIKLIHKVASQLGEEIEKFIGSGGFGFVFLLKSGRVLKLTSDKNEINLIYNLAKLSSIPKSLMTYYNIGEIKNANTICKYYILMDYVRELSRKEKLIVDKVYQNLIQYNTNYYANLMDKDLERKIADGELIIGTNYIKVALELLPHIRKIVKDLRKNGIIQTDFHCENLGWDKNDNLILFDLGGSFFQGDEPMDKTSKLKKMELESMITKFELFENIFYKSLNRKFEELYQKLQSNIDPMKIECKPSYEGDYSRYFLYEYDGILKIETQYNSGENDPKIYRIELNGKYIDKSKVSKKIIFKIIDFLSKTLKDFNIDIEKYNL